MSEVSRRRVLAGGAMGPLLAAQRNPKGVDVQGTSAPSHRRLLAGRFTPATLEKALQPRSGWHPYPKAADREAWSALPAEMRDTLIAAAGERAGKPYPPLPATLFLEYARNGNRSRYESVRSGRMAHLRESVIGECMEGKGRFLDDIADGVWTLCEETYWGYPAHLSLQKRGNGLPDVTEPTIDLFAGEAAALLAWTDYLLGPQLDKVSPLVRERIGIEIERRILKVYRERSDFWWMGLDPATADRPMNNWNPWVNSNVLTCVLLIDPDSRRRAETVHKVLRSLDRFLDSYHPDGGCDEGPSYWGHAGGSLFDNLHLLHSASNGRIDFYSLPLVREIGAYIYRAHIAGDWFVNFADASARIQIDPGVVYRYGRAIGDRNMQRLGALAGRKATVRVDALGRTLPTLFSAREMGAAEAGEPLVRDVWLPGIQFAAARQQEGSAKGLYFAALGGHNAESHNHNDVGNFIVFRDGEPLLIDAGVGVYTAKTFSPQRYEIWTMQSAFHNLPTINGVQQRAGRRFAARNVEFRSDAQAAEFRADIAGAYPAEAGLERWLRTVRLDRGESSIQVTEDYTLSAAGRVELSLLFARKVEPSPDALKSGSGTVFFQGPGSAEVRVEPVDTTDARLRPVWGNRIYRAIITWNAAPRSGQVKLRIT